MAQRYDADLAHQRCFNHARREAVARCPECSRYYCRECVTEHEDRVVCASCLARLTAGKGERRRPFAVAVRALECAVALLVLWLFFYTLGHCLLVLPTSFHEGTVWQAGSWEP